MTRFVFQGTGHTVGGNGKALGGVAAAVVIGALVADSVKSAAVAIGDLLVIVPAVLGGIALGAIASVVFLRLRNGRRADAQPRQAAEFWKVNPQAIPAPPRREIAAPVVNVNIDASLLAGLMAAMQQQPVRVIPEQSEQQEIPR